MYLLRSDNLDRLRNWSIRGGLAALDQGLFSGSNFILNVALARWISPVQYGAFAVGFAIYLFLSGFHNALILEPISVLGTSRHSAQLKLYLASQFISHLLVTGLMSSLAVLTTFLLFFLDLIGREIFQALVGIGLSLPFMLLIWLTRRIYYVLQRPKGSFRSTLIYSVSIFLFAYFLNLSPGRENISTWFAIMGLASLFGSLGIIFETWPSLLNAGAFAGWKPFLREQWIFGRWIVLASILHTIGTQIQIFVTASFLGLQSAGAYRALQNFMLPMFQLVGAASTLALPSIASEFGRGNFQGMRQKSLQVTVVLVGLAFCYEVMLFFGGGWAENFLYGGKYSNYVWLIPLIGLVPLINAMETGYSLILRSLQKPAFYLIDKSIAALIGGLSAFAFIANWMVSGAVLSLILIELSTVILYWWLNRRWFLQMAGRTLA